MKHVVDLSLKRKRNVELTVAEVELLKAQQVSRSKRDVKEWLEDLEAQIAALREQVKVK